MFDLFWIALAFGAGLVVGWVFLPEPEFVRRFFERIGIARQT